MRDESEDDEVPRSAVIDGILRDLPEGPPPPDLLGRCLATVPGPEAEGPIRRSRQALRFAAAAALLLGAAAWLARPIEADAAAQLKAVHAAWAEVPASHRVVRTTSPGVDRAEETWFVRGKGRRTELRSGGGRISLAVDNGRWQFRLDEHANLVAAWSTDLSVSPDRKEDAGLVVEAEAFLRWAEEHRGEIRLESEKLGATEARKVVVRWPGPTGAALPSEETVWFDPDSHRPLKQRVDYGDGRVAEMTIDYPTPDAVPGDLFAFRPPRDAAIEINDPDLGRQVYSPGLRKGDDR